MCRDRLDRWFVIGTDVVTRLRLDTPVGGWLPVLHDLFWRVTESNLPYADLFSPHLKVSICPSLSWSYCETPRDSLSAIASISNDQPFDALGGFKRLDPLRRFTLWTITTREIRHPDPIVGRSDRPFDLSSPHPHLVH